MPVNEFNEMKELEVMTFRRSIMYTCKNTVEERESKGLQGLALYIYPPDVHSTSLLPPHILQIIEKGNCWKQNFV